MSRYAKQDNALHEVTERYAKVDGVWRTVMARYAKQNGAWIQVYSSGKKLSDLPVGSLLKLAENGVPQQYIIVNQGNPDATLYDASCNGTWVLRKDISESRVWDSSNYNRYNFSTIAPYLNTTFFNTLSQNVQNSIITVKIPYCGGYKTETYTIMSGTSGLSAKVFLLSLKEFGENYYSLIADGAKLSYFESGKSDSANLKRVAYLNNSPAAYWTRSTYGGNDYIACMVWEQGEFYDSKMGLGMASSSSHGIRPAMILNSAALASSSPDSDGCYTLQ